MVKLENNVKVKPRSKNKIFILANECRKRLGITDKKNINIINLIELSPLGEFISIVKKEEIGKGNIAKMCVKNRVIKVPEDLYERLYNNLPRDKFTIAHELGHLVMHTEVFLARSEEKVKIYECPEWQANTFASGFLVPYHLSEDYTSEKQIVRDFGVSYSCAKIVLKRNKEIRLKNSKPFASWS